MYVEVTQLNYDWNFPQTSHKLSVNFKPVVDQVSPPDYA